MGTLTIRQNNSSGTVMATESRSSLPSCTWGGELNGSRTFNCANKIMPSNLVIGGKTLNCKDKMMPYNVWANYTKEMALQHYTNPSYTHESCGNGYGNIGNYACHYGGYFERTSESGDISHEGADFWNESGTHSSTTWTYRSAYCGISDYAGNYAFLSHGTLYGRYTYKIDASLTYSFAGEWGYSNLEQRKEKGGHVGNYTITGTGSILSGEDWTNARGLAADNRTGTATSTYIYLPYSYWTNDYAMNINTAGYNHSSISTIDASLTTGSFSTPTLNTCAGAAQMNNKILYAGRTGSSTYPSSWVWDFKMISNSRTVSEVSNPGISGWPSYVNNYMFGNPTADYALFAWQGYGSDPSTNIIYLLNGSGTWITKTPESWAYDAGSYDSNSRMKTYAGSSMIYGYSNQHYSTYGTTTPDKKDYTMLVYN